MAILIAGSPLDFSAVPRAQSVLKSSIKEFYLQLTKMHKRSFKLMDDWSEYTLGHTL